MKTPDEIKKGLECCTYEKNARPENPYMLMQTKSLLLFALMILQRRTKNV